MASSLGADNVRLVMSTDELLAEIASVVPHGHARRLVTRARRVAGIDGDDSLETIELLMILEAIASEGGPLQALAEVLARRALYPER